MKIILLFFKNFPQHSRFCRFKTGGNKNINFKLLIHLDTQDLVVYNLEDE